MFILRRFIQQIVITVVLGFVIRKLIASSNPRAKQIGTQANRVMGNVFGVDATGERHPTRRRGMVRSAASAAAGGAMSYFFDPAQGRDRRARAKTYASEHLRRNGKTSQPRLPEADVPHQLQP